MKGCLYDRPVAVVFFKEVILHSDVSIKSVNYEF